MHLHYLQINQAFAFVFGGIHGQLIPMDGKYLFNTRAEAVEAAGRCGLAVAGHGGVSINKATS